MSARIYAPESSQAGGERAKAALALVALGKQASCVAGRRTYDRVAARCTIAGVGIGERLRKAGISEGGNGTASDPRPTIVTRSDSGPAVVSAGAPFRSCAAARAAGAAPVYRGSPGYNPMLDGDDDGIACEPYRGRR